MPNMGYICRLNLVSSISLGGAIALAALNHETGDAQDAPSLEVLIKHYFQASSEDDRRQLARSIEEKAGGSIAAVAQAVQHAKLWRSLPQPAGSFGFDWGGGQPITVMYRVPEAYDPAVRYPAVWCMPDRDGPPPNACAPAVEALGDAGRDVVLLCPSRPVGGSFHQPLETAADFRRLIRRARQEIHLDAQGLFLFGRNGAGDRAWMAALTHPDLFAGAIVLASYPQLPFAEQVYPILLPNLRAVPVLSVWKNADYLGATPRQRLVAAHNRAIVTFAGQAGLDVTGVEVPYGASEDLRPPAGAVAAMLQRRRDPFTSEMGHWFRYPGQGHAGWLRQTQPGSEVWTAAQLDVLPAPGTDRHAYIREVVEQKLAYLGGRLTNESMVIEARGCARVEVLIPLDLAYRGRPLELICNGRRRQPRQIEPSIATLLEAAYESWDFQRLAANRFTLSLRSEVP